MLDLHRAVNHQMQLEFVSVDLQHDILEPVASMLHARVEDFQIRVSCPTNLVIRADKIRLKQIILNLANNARKFVHKGFIEIGAEIVNDCEEGRGGTVQVFVQDSGSGIPVEKRRQLFAKFQRSLDSLNQGTGIGLCLCKSLTELIGGSIYLDESYDSGLEGFPGARFVVDLQVYPLLNHHDDSLSSGDCDSCGSAAEKERSSRNSSSATESSSLSYAENDKEKNVSISFPRQISSETSQSPAAVGLSEGNADQALTPGSEAAEESVALPTENESGLPGKLSILVVDDDLIVRKLLLRSLRRVGPGWTIKEASNGETALRMDESEDFDLVLLDQYMASIEKQLLGTETARALRARGCQARVCGLSANDVENQFLACGATASMLKPFPCEKKALSKEILRLLALPIQQQRTALTRLGSLEDTVEE